MHKRTAFLVSAMLGISTSALAENDLTRQYLIDHAFLSGPSGGVTVVDREPVRRMDPATEYLVESGFMEAPSNGVRPERTDRTRIAEQTPVERTLIEWGYLSGPYPRR